MFSNKSIKTLIIFSAIIFCTIFVFSVGRVLAQTTEHTIEDYGLIQEDIKYLNQEEINKILSSKTPAELLVEENKRIEESWTPEQKAEFKALSLDVQPVLNKDIVDCFSYYRFGSVQTDIIAENTYTKPGSEIKFSGYIHNQNDYPIVSGTLYVKIFSNWGTRNGNGPDVVDQFIVADNLTIPAKGKIPSSFIWKVPLSSLDGEYRIGSYFTVDKKYNLLGLSFTDDVIGSTSSFYITTHVAPQKTNVQFDKAGVTINNTPYFFAAFPPRISIENSAVASAKIDNTTDQDEIVNIVWKLYRWDSINLDNYIRTVSDQATIKAKSSSKIQITIPEATDSVYYLVGELFYKDSKSIVGIRFVRPEVDKIRLNFPSITSFPIKQGITSTIFSCLHNSGTSQSIPNSKLTLKLTDVKGKIINEYTYSGAVTGNMMAVKNDFVSKTTLDHFFLTAQLWQADKLVDQSTLEYDCNKIDSKLCNSKSDWNIYIIFGAIVLVATLVIGALIIYFRRKNKI